MKLNNIPKIIGHRGAAGLAPENTLSSIIKAYKSGLVFIEIDVKVTKTIWASMIKAFIDYEYRNFKK